MSDDPETLQEAMDKSMDDARAVVNRINGMNTVPRVLIGVVVSGFTISMMLLCVWVLYLGVRWMF